MHLLVKAYMKKISNNDRALTEIILVNLNLTDSDIAPLIELLANNQEATERIIHIDLSYNRLTQAPFLTRFVELQRLSLEYNQLPAAPDLTKLVKLQSLDLSGNPLKVAPDLTGLVALQSLYLHDTLLIVAPDLTELVALQAFGLNSNQLTDASKIALNAEKAMRGGNIQIFYDNPIPLNTALTAEILNEHFRYMLQVNPNEAIGYLKNLLKTIGATQLVRMPAEHLTMLNKMLPTPEIARAQASMANFQSIFSRLAELNNDESQLNTLNMYIDARFEPLVEATEGLYRTLFNSLKNVIRARGAKRDNPATLNQPPTINPVIFSSTPLAAEEARNNACSDLIIRYLSRICACKLY